MLSSDSRCIPIAITDYSVCNALGLNRDTFAEALFAGKDGLAPHQGPPGTYLGRCADGLSPLPSRWVHYDSRSARLLWAALQPLLASAAHAVERWGAARVAVIVGTSTGGVESSERALAHLHNKGSLPAQYSWNDVHALDALSRFAREALGSTGPAYVVSTACSSSAKALASAQRLISVGRADAVLVAGVDCLCDTTLYGFHALSVLSEERCQPFGVTRSGINLAEGAACLLLERAAHADRWLIACGESSDAHHPSSPHPEGVGAAFAMCHALQLGNLQPGQVDYVNAHGTGTALNDSAEARALQRVFDPIPPVSSSKGATGHLLGAAGATEAIVCLEALRRGLVPPNLPDSSLDPALGLAPLPDATARPLCTVLSNSFAFGGSNCSVVLGNTLPDHRAPANAQGTNAIQIMGYAVWPPHALHPDAAATPSTPDAALLPARLRGRASLLSRMFAEVLERVLQSTDFAAAEVPIVYGSAFGETTTLLELLHLLRQHSSSPAKFQASVHNTASGLISIATRNQGFSTTVVAGRETMALALLEGIAWLEAHGGDVIVIVGDEPAPQELGQLRSLRSPAHLHCAANGALRAGCTLRHWIAKAHQPARSTIQVGGNPCAPLLDLARAIEQGQAGRVSLAGSSGVGWALELRVSGA